MKRERRMRRSDITTVALAYQLDECRRAAQLEAMVLSDEVGVCLALSGDPYSCEEVAARLPLVGRRVRDFDGVLFSPERGFAVRMRRFQIGDSDLYVCAIGGRPDQRDRQIMRSITGVTRILQSPAATT
jgi:hypothetical protein